MEEKQVPHYELAAIKRLVTCGQFGRTTRVARHVRSRGWGDQDITRCFEQMLASDFHKTQRHRERPGQWLDIYRPWIDGVRMYVKFTVDTDGSVVILSLCRDGTAH